MYKVLVIDDEEIIREGLIKTIDWEKLSCRIVGEAEDGDEGLKQIQEKKPDLIITDIRMPGLNGLQMIHKMKMLKHDCKILIITGYREFEYAQEAVRLGAFRFLLKPINTNELINGIDEAISEIKQSRIKETNYHHMKKKVQEYYGIKNSPHVSDYDAKKEGISEVESTSQQGNSSYIVNRALSFMKEHYHEDINLKIVADHLYVSIWHLSKVIKKETGSNFVDILNNIRIEEAKKVLTNPKYKIYEIAEIVGFNDVPYFTKLFKKITGITPVEFKNTSCINK